jgi:hypothetical protein
VTLKWTETAPDCQIARTLCRLVQDKVWYDGTHWWSVDHDGNWGKQSRNRPSYHKHWIQAAGGDLPNHPYWSRTRYHLGMYYYRIQRLIAEGVRYGFMYQPTELDVPYRWDIRHGDCLCISRQCEIPPLPY